MLATELVCDAPGVARFVMVPGAWEGNAERWDARAQLAGCDCDHEARVESAA